jgi:hypothetical protein
MDLAYFLQTEELAFVLVLFSVGYLVTTFLRVKFKMSALLGVDVIMMSLIFAGLSFFIASLFSGAVVLLTTTPFSYLELEVLTLLIMVSLFGSIYGKTRSTILNTCETLLKQIDTIFLIIGFIGVSMLATGILSALGTLFKVLFLYVMAVFMFMMGVIVFFFEFWVMKMFIMLGTRKL